jgi:D-3-phosphoglycerate dehydrogenase / 2-oxoglutarate reductase
MSLGRVLIERFHPDVVAWLKERVEVLEIDPWVDTTGWDREASRADAVISRKGQIKREHLAHGRIKIVARTGVGVDASRVDLDAAREFRVWVTNQPGSNSVAVTELVFAQMLALVRHTHAANIAVREGRWGDYTKFVGTEMAGKTIGIVGMGNIGTRVALRARAFEMDLLVYDPYIPASHVTALGGRYVDLETLLRESDFVTIHCPKTSETDGMIAAGQLGLMKRTAILINAARGGIVEESELYHALSRGELAGAALDAMEHEPPAPEHPLFTLDNVLLTPHIGAGTEEASARGEWGAAEEVIRVLEGKRPKNPVVEFE